MDYNIQNNFLSSSVNKENTAGMQSTLILDLFDSNFGSRLLTLKHNATLALQAASASLLIVTHLLCYFNCCASRLVFTDFVNC